MWWIRHKTTGEVLVLNKRLGQPSVLGETVLGYGDRGRAIAALKASGIMATSGWRFTDLELFNGVNTMDEMVAYPVSDGYALRHRVDKWYWRQPHSGRVWYQRPKALETAWIRNERVEAVSQRRRLYAGPGRAKLELVRGYADGGYEIRPNWFV